MAIAEKAKSLRQLGRLCFEEAQGDRAKAKELFFTAIDNDVEYLRMCKEVAANYYVSGVYTEERKLFWATSQCRDDTGDLDMMLRDRYQDLLDWPMKTSAGTLGDADKEGVEMDAAWYETQVTSHMKRGKWMRLIANAMGEAQYVRQALKHDKLHLLLMQAENAA